MNHQSVISLAIVWDDEKVNAPENWDWVKLLKENTKDITVIESREVPLGMVWSNKPQD